MNFFDNSKSVVENLSFLTAPIIAIVSVLGLRQLKIAKDSIRINSKRESAHLAFNLCEKYFPIMDKQYLEIVDILEENKIDPLLLQEFDIYDFENINKTQENYDVFKSTIQIINEYDIEFTELAESLELFAHPFLIKIADEEVAYNLEHMRFIQFTNICSPLIVTSLKQYKEKHPTLYENTIKLYGLWRDRSEAERNDNHINKLVNKNSKLRRRKINPLGTE